MRLPVIEGLAEGILTSGRTIGSEVEVVVPPGSAGPTTSFAMIPMTSPSALLADEAEPILKR